MTNPSAAPFPQLPPTTSRTGVLADRVLLLDRPQYVQTVPDYLDTTRSGLVLCGPKAAERAYELYRADPTVFVLEDCAAYEKRLATPEEPFQVDHDTLFGGDLDSILQDQRNRGAPLAVTTSLYVQAGATAAFKALVEGARQIQRDDVIVLVPISVAWLGDQTLRQLIAGLQRIPHAKALVLGSKDNNPYDGFAKATENLRKVLAAVPNLGLWRTDVLGAFDCIAHGGLFAIIGAGGSIRHLVPPGEPRRSVNFVTHPPSVLIPRMLRYALASTIADRYATVRAPRCGCAACNGDLLDSFNDTSKEVRAAAHAHNALTWTAMLPDLLGHPTLSDRQRWWINLCRLALLEHETENGRIEQPGAFKPSTHLKKLATLADPGIR